MGRRSISLKEFIANLDYTISPDEGYVNLRGGKPTIKPYRVQTDGDGFIKSGREETEIRIIGLGDSVLECLFVEEEHRICARLEWELEKKIGQSITVLNGGYSGATSLHILNTFVNKIVPLKPHAVFLMTGIMDLEAMFKVDSFWSIDGYLRSIVEDENNPGVWDQNFRSIVDSASRLKLQSLIVRAGSMFDIPVCCIATPHLQSYAGSYINNTYPDPSVYFERVNNRRAANKSIEDFCYYNGIKYFDTQDSVANVEGAFCDDIHLNITGTHLVAKSIIDQGFGEFIRSAIANREVSRQAEKHS